VTVDGDGLAGPVLRFVDGSGGSNVRSLLVRGSDSDGVEVDTADNVRITRSPIFANALLPIDLVSGGNLGVTAPQNVRVGPRRADNSLPVTGATASGTVEIFKGDPAGSAPTTFLADTPGGDFSYTPSPELAPGDKVAATFTNPTGSTSELSATATVPSDIVSPVLAGSRALSTSSVFIQPSEPIDGATVQLSDFTVEMAGVRRTVTAGAIASDGSSLTLATSTAWKAGEAGFVELAGPGAVGDVAGNQNVDVSRVRVAAAPGDFIAPVITSLSFKPTRICLTRNRRCRKPGMTLTFVASEEGRGTLQAVRGSRANAKNFDVVAGKNTYRFDGRFRGRKLRAGRYGLVITMRDVVGNVASETPFRTFYVKRTTARR
jgi:hypothetical protein